MVVKWRPEVWGDADGTTKVARAAKITKTRYVLRDRPRARALVAKASTRSFYFAHCGSSHDDCQHEKEERGCELSRYSV